MLLARLPAAWLDSKDERAILEGKNPAKSAA
jgi:hypothetical protein